ncbi:hypothetical protein ACFY3M_06585 [Streptomyces mirabilis]|uniref:hypothetical protein n=1 Tax=Streptomyces mirabilis TaxID=68239 RepID=UPI0036A92D45
MVIRSVLTAVSGPRLRRQRMERYGCPQSAPYDPLRQPALHDGLPQPFPHPGFRQPGPSKTPQSY